VNNSKSLLNSANGCQCGPKPMGDGNLRIDAQQSANSNESKEDEDPQKTQKMEISGQRRRSG
jgi:hypothetical protein